MPISKHRRRAPAEAVYSLTEEVMAQRVAAVIREQARTDPEVRALLEKLVDERPYIRLGELRP
jgi:hypothetical protein